ncbi:MAG: hypothetical protein LQ352_002884 [Teloschistes flavicans]|nr:MAG: hypothetical protein LQ352_002884 [Teloschistes flavicans]
MPLKKQNAFDRAESGSDRSSCEEQNAAGPIKDSTAYAQNHVTEHLHPAFVDSGFKYDTDRDCFAAEFEETYDEAALLDGQQAFADALQQFQEGIHSKYKSKVDLSATHTWTEVIEYAEVARRKYIGVEQRGIARKVNNGLKKFQTAAPAIEAWLKLLPSTSWYGSIICGGLTIILEAAVNLRKFRKETLTALDQIPQCIEKAEFLMRTYGYVRVNSQVGNLYLAILNALQYILEWYQRAAGIKFFSAFWKGPAYAERLKNKIKEVNLASQAMTERASQSDQMRLKEIRTVTAHSMVGELKILAVEARNHLYEVLKDTELWREAVQSWQQSRLTDEDQKAIENQALLEKEENNKAVRRSLLACFDAYHDDSSRDMERVLGYITSMTLGDQDRVGAMIQHPATQDWLFDPLFGALLVNGNCRRPDPIAPTSVACSLLIHVFTRKVSLPTLYWFCGLHAGGPHGNPLGMLRGLIGQLLGLSRCRCSPEDRKGLDMQDLGKLLKLFRRLLRRSTVDAPLVCILDGLSFYETRHQSSNLSQIISELAKFAKSSSPRLILLLTSPIRTSFVGRQRQIVDNVTVAEIPDHVCGAKQGLDSHHIMSTTEKRARKLSESLGSGRKASKGQDC